MKQSSWKYREDGGFRAIMPFYLKCTPNIKHNGYDFHCSEHIYYYDIVKDAGDKRAEEAVCHCKDD